MTDSPQWKELSEYFVEIQKKFILKDEFAKDSKRFEKYSQKFLVDDHFILVDYSKNFIDEKIMKLLFEISKKADLDGYKKKMFNGEIINFTEKRAVLHVALRNLSKTPIMVDGKDVMPEVFEALDKMKKFVSGVLGGTITGYTGAKFTDVVNIGIGGSDLGPLMVTEALKPFSRNGLHPHFVSNIDGSHLAEVLRSINPETTLFIISSKTFTTIETITNALSAKKWFVQKSGSEEAVSKNFIAVSTNAKKVGEFGINVENMFEFWDWVGGRYSLWSSIGISIALTIGWENFHDLLKGAHAMDEHFKNIPVESNIPAILGLIGLLYNNFDDRTTHALFPYDQYMHRFAAYFQQGDMESNGKYVNRLGHKITSYNTGPIIWGEPGTNGQHAFFQLLHQGTRKISCDFLCPLSTHNPISDGIHHQILYANFLAQTEALMNGKTTLEVKKELEGSNMSMSDIDALIPHKVFEGNRPSNSIVTSQINPKTLGALIGNKFHSHQAMYEHKIFLQGIIWNINSFDQFGVELGKQLSNKILDEIKQSKISHHHDSSTSSLLDLFIKHQHK